MTPEQAAQMQRIEDKLDVLLDLLTEEPEPEEGDLDGVHVIGQRTPGESLG